MIRILLAVFGVLAELANPAIAAQKFTIGPVVPVVDSSNAWLYIGREKGIFEKHGIEIKTESMAVPLAHAAILENVKDPERGLSATNFQSVARNAIGKGECMTILIAP